SCTFGRPFALLDSSITPSAPTLRSICAAAAQQKEPISAHTSGNVRRLRRRTIVRVRASQDTPMLGAHVELSTGIEPRISPLNAGRLEAIPRNGASFRQIRITVH